MTNRSSGILLHPTSLPGGPIGDLGATAFAFVDWLAESGQASWQILPLNAVDEGGSPYNALSAFAGNPLLVDLQALVAAGLLGAAALDAPAELRTRLDFPAVSRWKEERLTEAHRAFREGAAPELAGELEEYRARNAGWLDDYALFRALRHEHGGAPWNEWTPGLRERDEAALAEARERFSDAIDRRAFWQFLFDRQWAALRAHAAARGVRVIGDIPIFVAYDSADVWAHPELFELDARERPTVVSGVPPDYFSETGQRWGNPLYRWDALEERGYDWWVERFRRTFEWVDVVRIDHFRGFESYWAIPAREETAIRGEWRKGPGADFFRAVESRLGSLPVIAEDLGLITPEVEALRDELGLPGMRVLQFGFDGEPENPHLPENYPAHAVVYTGTHDNDTIEGWWEKATDAERLAVHARMAVDPAEPHWSFIRAVMDSGAELAIFPAQDVLGLGSEARMNTPGTSAANWVWRLEPGELSSTLAARLREATERAGRL